ncbi:MAG: hypothetical protein U5K77_02500 [Candidatus Saccharibacteria bacterium]|nr:hypothetical protein [Candidatus Saccharibacteria bacterium]
MENKPDSDPEEMAYVLGADTVEAEAALYRRGCEDYSSGRFDTPEAVYYAAFWAQHVAREAVKAEVTSPKDIIV